MAILPIVTYDDPVLSQNANPVNENSDELQQLIDDMFETMYNAEGVGLAAPQVGQSIRLFVIDADSMVENEADKYGPMTFINPEIKECSEDKSEEEEGCLSLPDIRENVIRPEQIVIEYLDRDFEQRRLKVSEWIARVIQHEFDHINGILFIDHLGSFRRRLLKSKLKQVAGGRVETNYPLKAPETQVG